VKAPGNNRNGFTLIELMTAMTILVVIVMMMTMIFNDADKIWYLGTGRTLNCISGRAAMGLITHDLEYAVADDLLTFAIRQDKNKSSSYGFNHDEICCVSLQNDSTDGNRAAREIFYYVADTTGKVSTLMKGYYSSAIVSTNTKHCYYTRTWYDVAGRPPDSRPIVEHVTAFSLFAPTNQNGCCKSGAYYSTNSYEYGGGYYMSNSLPEFVDVYLEVLDEMDADKLAEMEKNLLISDATKRAFIERSARRYTTRVSFHNRLGYKKR